jgi:hypothetical protein
VVKKRKCSFGATTVTHLSHIIFTQGVAMDVKKVEALQAWLQPHSVRGFHGLIGYYKKFICSYDDIAAPLTQLLEKEAFCWTPTSFQALRTVITTAQVLQQPDFSKAFTMHCDALRSGFRVVLHQGGKLIAFFSPVISTHHANLPPMNVNSLDSSRQCGIGGRTTGHDHSSSTPTTTATMGLLQPAGQQATLRVCSEVLYLSAEQNRASLPDGSSSTSPRARNNLERHRHGFDRGVSQSVHQVDGLGGGGPFLEVRPLHHMRKGEICIRKWE